MSSAEILPNILSVKKTYHIIYHVVSNWIPNKSYDNFNSKSLLLSIEMGLVNKRAPSTLLQCSDMLNEHLIAIFASYSNIKASTTNVSISEDKTKKQTKTWENNNEPRDVKIWF